MQTPNIMQNYANYKLNVTLHKYSILYVFNLTLLTNVFAAELR